MRHRSWRWESPERYYILRLCQDLFGTWILVKVWGGKDNRKCGTKTEAFDDAFAIDAEIAAVFKKRKRRGYVLIEK